MKGQLVYCRLSTWGSEAVVKAIGGIGTIIESEQVFEIAQMFMAPATIVNSSIGQIITNYTKSTRYHKMLLISLWITSKVNIWLLFLFFFNKLIINESLLQHFSSYISHDKFLFEFLVKLRSPSAVIHKSHEVKIPAPFAASFSPRGPNTGSQHILKVLVPKAAKFPPLYS